EIVRPVALTAHGQAVELSQRPVSITAKRQLTIPPQPKRHGDMPIDGRGKDPTLVVIGVFADDVHASGRDRNGGRRIAKGLAKATSGAFVQLMRRTHGRSIWAKSHSRASCGFAAVGSSGSVRRTRSKRQVWIPMIGRRLRSASAIS